MPFILWHDLIVNGCPNVTLNSRDPAQKVHRWFRRVSYLYFFFLFVLLVRMLSITINIHVIIGEPLLEHRPVRAVHLPVLPGARLQPVAVAQDQAGAKLFGMGPHVNPHCSWGYTRAARIFCTVVSARCVQLDVDISICLLNPTSRRSSTSVACFDF